MGSHPQLHDSSVTDAGGVKNTAAIGLEVTNSEIVTYVYVLLILIAHLHPDLTVPDVK